MAFRQILLTPAGTSAVNPPEYLCESTDTKVTAGIQEGAKLYETDTGRDYVFDGADWSLRRVLVDVEVESIVATDVTLAGNKMDRRGLAAARPAAGTVPAGTTYWAADTKTLSESDGTNWITVIALT